MNHFPIFADLHHQPVLVVGGGMVAERKIRSLLDAGADVLLVAQKLNAQVRQWADSGRITLLGTDFDAAYVHEAVLVIAATNNEALNQAVSAAARAAKKLVNVVDRLDLCTFTMPAVIDRSPIQIAISSGGTSPVLARRIRQQIETQVPLHTGLMAELAGQHRSQVKAVINTLPERRRFWENLFDSDFSHHAAQQNRAAAAEVLTGRLKQHAAQQGSVTLVGAGPGDAGLLTLHALHAIQAADVVLYDALVGDEVMQLVRKDAEKVYVGKRARNHQVVQEETNDLLVRYAEKGLRVVRLKGGDPFVFGRGGEELQVLAEAGIPFRIVPGITAALGAAAYAGIPLTHRDCAQSVQFVTGHCKADGSDVDWRCFARANQTLAVYMGTIRAADLSEKLIRCGRAADTPVAVISNGTRVNQSVCTGTLGDLAGLAAQAPTPALIIIGEVAALHRRLQWFGSAEAPEKAFQTA